MMLVRFAILAFWLLLCHVSQAFSEPAIPPLTGRVVDVADILTEANERDLTNQLAAVETKTGAQIVVAILPRLDGYPVENWGLALGRGWQIGRKGRDDGIVIVLAPNDHEVRIEVGYGLESKVPDFTAYRIIHDYMLPAAKDDQFAAGLDATVAALERAIIDHEPVFPPTSGKLSIVIILVMFAATAGLTVMIFSSLRDRSRNGPYQARSNARSANFFDDLRWTQSYFDPSSSNSGSSFGHGGFRGGGGSFGGGGASGKW